MRIRNKIDKILEIVLIGLMSLLVLDVLWQVVSRYVLSEPSAFTDELAGFLLIWVGLLGAAYSTGKKEHLAIDLAISKLSPSKRKKVDIIIYLLMSFFSITVLIIGGSWLVYTRFYLGQLSAALNLPLGYVYSILPVCGFIITYYCVDDIWLLINRKTNQPS